MKPSFPNHPARRLAPYGCHPACISCAPCHSLQPLLRLVKATEDVVHSFVSIFASLVRSPCIVPFPSFLCSFKPARRRPHSIHVETNTQSTYISSLHSTSFPALFSIFSLLYRSRLPHFAPILPSRYRAAGTPRPRAPGLSLPKLRHGTRC